MIPGLVELGLGAVSYPLARDDVEHLDVSVVGLGLFFLGCLGASAWIAPGPLADQLGLSAGVLVVGMVVWAVLPGRLGEADLVFAGALALITGFWSFLIVMALACLGGLGNAVILVLRSGSGLDRPLPFVALMYWGWVTVVLAALPHSLAS